MCNFCEYDILLDEIDEALDNPNCDFAIDTLEGIRCWVSKNEHCTDNQKSAVCNIISSIED